MVYIGQRGDKLSDIPAKHPTIDKVYSVRAGKFRRYNGETWRLFLDVQMLLKNFRDFLWLIIGILQSYRLIKRIKPSVIFTPGGFVGVPVGLAASRLRVPFITHDLDAIPGLANRINARWAVAHAVALPPETYSYPKDKTFYVGVPVSDKFQPVTQQQKSEYRQSLGLPVDAKVLCVTGGGLGADRINIAIATLSPTLLKQYSDLMILHIAGRKNESQLLDLYDKLLTSELRSKVVVKGFVSDLYRYSAAADVIVARAGATNMAEFALQRRACIVIPNPVLTGGHQLKNAELLAKSGAITVVREPDMGSKLLPSISELFDSIEKRQALSGALSKFAKPNATYDLTQLIINIASGQGVKN